MYFSVYKIVISVMFFYNWYLMKGFLNVHHMHSFIECQHIQNLSSPTIYVRMSQLQGLTFSVGSRFKLLSTLIESICKWLISTSLFVQPKRIFQKWLTLAFDRESTPKFKPLQSYCNLKGIIFSLADMKCITVIDLR